MQEVFYDKNGAILVGKVSSVNDSYIYVDAENNVFPIFVTNTVKAVKQKVADAVSSGQEITAVVYGLLTNGESKDYIYPVGIAFSSLSQPPKRFATVSGTVLGIYTYENRKRIRLSVERKKTTSVFVTLFNSRGINVDNSLIGKKIIIDGLLEYYKDKLTVVADYLFIEYSPNESDANVNNVTEMNTKMKENFMGGSLEELEVEGDFIL